jgi:hypothetical protein
MSVKDDAADHNHGLATVKVERRGFAVYLLWLDL